MEDNFRQIFELFKDPIIILNSEGYIHEINIIGRDLFKIKDAIFDLHFSSLFNSNDEYKIIGNQIEQNGSISEHLVKLNDSDGNIINVSLSVKAIKDEDRLTGYFCQVCDVTKQKEVENLLIRSIIEIQENERIGLGKKLQQNTAHQLAIIGLYQNMLSKKYREIKNDEIFINISQITNSLIEEINDICFDIMPKSLEILGLKYAIIELKKRYNFLNNLNISFEGDFPRFPNPFVTFIFRLLQGLLYNSMNYNNKNTVDMHIKYQLNIIYISLKYEIAGFNNEHFYLEKPDFKVIKSSINAFNGEIKINSMPGSLVEVNVIFPVPPSF